MRNLIFILSVLFLGFSYAAAQTPPPPATIASFKTKVLCPNAASANVIGISNIIFNSPIGDSVYLTFVGSLSTSNLVTTSTINEQSGSHVLFATPSTGGVSGDFDIEIKFKYATDTTIYYDTITVTVAPTPDLTLTSAMVCEGADEFDLYAHVATPGGSFTINPANYRVENGLFNPKEFIAEYSSFGSFVFQYEYIDTNGCIFSSTGTENISFTPGPEIILGVVINTECNDDNGEIPTIISAINGPYSSYWNNGVQNKDTLTDLTAGEYYLTVIDNAGCTNTLSAIVETDDFIITPTVSNVKCKGGSDGKIDINIAGANASGNYKIMWSSGHGSTSVTNLVAGTYLVNVVDLSTGCEGYKRVVVTEPLLEFSFSATAVGPDTCSQNTGAITLSGFVQASTPYQYLWNTGATGSSITGLGVGHYSLEVTDGKGCKANYNVDLNHYSTPVPQYDIVEPTCGNSNGAIYLNTFSSSTIIPLSYLWSNGAITRNISDLSAGQYSLNVTYNNGCTSTHTYQLNNTQSYYTPKICIVTVDTVTNTNLVVWEKEAGNPNSIVYYNIYRANSTTGEYQLIDTVNYTSISVFNDVVASPEIRSWKYKISTVNSCGEESHLSNRHKTIHLVMTDGIDPNEKMLTWDHYEGLEYFYYDLYRGTNEDGWQLIQGNISVSALPGYVDIIPTGSTGVDYIVEVLPIGGGCTATYNKAQDYNSSRSNKPTPIFDPGVGTGDPSNSLVSYENDEFKALVYPNPSNGDFKIEITDNINNQNLKLTILGVNGKTVHQQTLSNDLNTIQLDVDSGIYFVKIQGESVLETIRIIVQ